jgi:hypothetical protein
VATDLFNLAIHVTRDKNLGFHCPLNTEERIFLIPLNKCKDNIKFHLKKHDWRVQNEIVRGSFYMAMNFRCLEYEGNFLTTRTNASFSRIILSKDIT